MLEMLLFAAKIALPDEENDNRGFWLGCVGLRSDGTLVFSKNGSVFSTITENYQLLPGSHAECRVLRKMDWGGTLYVARVARKDRTIAMARPCPICQVKIKAKGIKKVYYSINPTQWGVWNPKTDTDRIYSSAG